MSDKCRDDGSMGCLVVLLILCAFVQCNRSDRIETKLDALIEVLEPVIEERPAE